MSNDMRIVVQREKVNDGLVTGTIAVNGQIVGRAYENDALKIPAGRYSGILRSFSPEGKNFVQGDFGTIGKSGDFLIEVANVPGRTAILFHGGNKPHHSRGCILLGPVSKDPKTHIPHLEYDHPLRRLRRLFYGTESPNQTPDKSISIQVNDINACFR